MAKTSLIEGDVRVDVPRPQSARTWLRPWRRPTGHDLSALRVPSGLPWILPALVLCVGLIYYCVGYTGYISTLSWDGVSPNPPSVGIHNYTGVFHDPVFWGAIKHTAIFFCVTFVGQTFLGMLFAVLLHSKVKLAVIYKVIIFVPVVLAPAIMAPVFRQMFSPPGQFNEVLHHLGLGFLTQPWIGQEPAPPLASLPLLPSGNGRE